jgi:NAD-dependent SIR2 family protein deacetylase
MNLTSETKKTKIVFLGAGASAGFGFPVTDQILPRILERLDPPILFGNDVEQAKELESHLNVILPGLTAWRRRHASPAKDSKGLPAITDVLSLVDHLILQSNAASSALALGKLMDLRMLLERAIFEILTPSYSVNEKTVPDTQKDLLIKAEEQGFLLPSGGDAPPELVSLVNWLESEARDSKVVLITTNYDLLVETELYKRRSYDQVWNDIDFGFEVRHPNNGQIVRAPHTAKFGVYKLHGSLNWLRCDLCNHVYVNPAGAIAYLAFSKDAGDAGKCHCGFSPLRHLMVAPSHVRDIRDPNLLQVWRNSVEAMREADEWVIIGYSLPPEDIAIRSLFLRALNARMIPEKPTITVVQKGNDAKLQYDMFFGKTDYRANKTRGFLRSRGFVVK